MQIGMPDIDKCSCIVLPTTPGRSQVFCPLVTRRENCAVKAYADTVAVQDFGSNIRFNITSRKLTPHFVFSGLLVIEQVQEKWITAGRERLHANRQRQLGGFRNMPALNCAFAATRQFCPTCFDLLDANYWDRRFERLLCWHGAWSSSQTAAGSNSRGTELLALSRRNSAMAPISSLRKERSASFSASAAAVNPAASRV